MSSNRKPISQKRAEREQQENQALTRVFTVFLAGFAAECYLFILYRAATGTINSMLTCYQILGYITWLGLIPLAVGAAGAYVKRSDRRMRNIMLAVGCVGLFLTVSGWIMTNFSNDHKGIITMCALVPVAAVLALVFLLYQHECFIGTLALAGAMFVAWVRGASVYADAWRVPVIAGGVVGAVILAALAALARKAQQSGGKLRGVRVCSLECDYRVLYGVLAVGFVGVLAAVAVAGIATYVMWALGIAMLAELVYYTSRLM